MKTITLTLILIALLWTVQADSTTVFTAEDSARIVAMFHNPIAEARGWGEIFYTNHVEIFHGPTASSVRNYMETWVKERGYEILDTDLFIDRNLYNDSIWSMQSRYVNDTVKVGGRMIPTQYLKSTATYYLTVTYRRKDILWQNGDITHK